MGIFLIYIMMNIVFREKHKSIEEFDSVVLPDFTLLIGVNGAGKSHFLEAIRDIKISFSDKRLNNILYFNNDSFTISESWNSTYEDYETSHTMVPALWGRLEIWLRDSKNKLQIIDDKIREIIWNRNFPYSNPISEDHEIQIQKIKELICSAEYIDNCEDAVFSTWKYITDFTKEDFVKYNKLTFWLQINISDIFGNYKVEQLRRQSWGMDIESEIAPWEVINMLFEQMKMSHRITYPQFSSGDIFAKAPPPFQAKLMIWTTEINFKELSSWEKTLLGIVLSFFQENYISFPKIILLDEVDAFLNPKMIEELVKVINTVFLPKGCKVIMTTHSPTTCALVNDIHIYEMLPWIQKEKIRKINKVDAIKNLSDGIMTLEEWLKIFDEACKKKLTIFSEGKNVWHISHALKKMGTNLEEVEIYEYEKNHAGWMGSSSIFWLFEMFKRFTLKNHVLFIWDCDNKEQVVKMQSTDNVHKYCFSKNEDNKLVKKGIENLYPQELTQVFLETNKSEYLMEDLKAPFEDYIKTLDGKEVFNNYKDLEDKIQEILMK